MTPDRLIVTLAGAILIAWVLWYFLGTHRGDRNASPLTPHH